jgi:DNA-binding response OmpR family regulator
MSVDQIRVVVVDDSLDAAEAMSELLQLNGCKVRVCTSAENAFGTIEQFEPHCVIFDILMPGIRGDELCTRLRARYGDDIVLVAVTGYDDSNPSVAKTFELADHYFTKPVDPAALAKLLHPLA